MLEFLRVPDDKTFGSCVSFRLFHSFTIEKQKLCFSVFVYNNILYRKVLLYVFSPLTNNRIFKLRESKTLFILKGFHKKTLYHFFIFHLLRYTEHVKKYSLCRLNKWLFSCEFYLPPNCTNIRMPFLITSGTLSLFPVFKNKK